MKTILAIILLFLFFLSFNYCASDNSNKGENGESISKQDTNSSIAVKTILQGPKLTEEQKLLLINQIPIGTSYQDIKPIFSNLSDIKIEHSRNNLNEARASVEIFNINASIEFNFRFESVYSYYYIINELENHTADSLYKHIQKFYRENYGKYLEEKDSSSSGHTSISSFWYQEMFSVVLTNNIYKDNSLLSWGFQKP